MTNQAYTATVKAHQERQQAIYADLQRLISESREIVAELQRLQADRLTTQRRKETVQHGNRF